MEKIVVSELSVCIPTYNCAEFLQEAIESVMRQGLNDFEIIISDNASQDDTESVINRLNNKHIRYFRNKINMGSRENFNNAISKAQGQYIKLLCSDDVLLDGILLKQLHVLKCKPEISLVTCNLLMADKNLKIGRGEMFFPGCCAGSRVINSCLSNLTNYIGGPSNIMFRQIDAKKIKFDQSYKFVSDLKFGIQLLEVGKYCNIDEFGYLYRRHLNTDTETSCPMAIRMPEYVRLVDEYSWWNPLNCVQVMRRGAVRNSQKGFMESLCCSSSPTKLLRVGMALYDTMRIRLQDKICNAY
jgi:glycosyltransferase involved in cell wall biosynthesis